jgi:hypothetical protein
VYTVVVLTRLPTKEELKFDVGVLSSKLSTLDGKELKDFGHRLVFVNARASKGGMPEGVRKWMEERRAAAGAWWIGRLQTDADRERVVEAVTSEGDTDGTEPSELDEVIKRLAPRWCSIARRASSHEPAGRSGGHDEQGRSGPGGWPAHPQPPRTAHRPVNPLGLRGFCRG